MKAINLKTEYLTEPLGIDFEHPRLMWNCEGGVYQTAYRVVASSPQGRILWDSGKVISSKMTFIRYPIRCRSRSRIYWKVKLWDENGNEGNWSDTTFFEIGLRSAADFKAKWITGDYIPDTKRYNKKRMLKKSFLLSGIDFLAESSKAKSIKRYPVDCFKKEFSAKGNIKTARLYATACGLYSVKINGEIISMPLAPGITNYNQRVQYQTYDITALINENNTIEAELADGWYRGSCGAWGLKEQYGTQTKFLAQLEITYADGKIQTVITDEKWRWSNDGPIRFADNKDGEIVDADQRPSYSDYAKVTSCTVTPTASNNVEIKERERFKPEIIKTPSGKTVLDFKQNFAGYLEFSLIAKRGDKVFLRFGEMLDESGEFTQKNIQCKNKHVTSPLQQVVYTCKDGENYYKTKFAVFGFRYVLVETDVPFAENDFTGIAVYSDMERTGFFESSNELLNKFVEATVWSTKSNSLDLPTDCPTRERHGWTGDAQLFLNSASYLFDYATFADKFERDLCDEQKKNGCFGQIAPSGGVDFYMNFMDGSAGWSDAGVFIPYRLYKKYNDVLFIEKYFANMKRFVEFKVKTIGKLYPTAIPTGVGAKYARYIVNYGQSYGEWAEPADVKPMEIADFVSPHPEESTAYMLYLLDVMIEICAVLGKTEDEERYKSYYSKLKVSYQKLVSTKKFSIDTDRQSKLVRPLYMNLLEKTETEFAKKRLIKALENYDWRLGTGFLSTPLILYVLSDIDIEYAYRLLENEKMPGWLFMTKMGATTIWESWEGTEAQGGIASLNHYSKGAVCEWLFSSMCGINVAGENHFVIKPSPGGHFTYAAASYKSIFGTVKSGWKTENGKTAFTVKIPSNCTADIVLPNGENHFVRAGKYAF